MITKCKHFKRFMNCRKCNRRIGVCSECKLYLIQSSPELEKMSDKVLDFARTSCISYLTSLFTPKREKCSDAPSVETLRKLFPDLD